MEIKAERTVRRIIKWVFWVAVVVLILLWFLGGGVGKIIDTAKSLHFTTFADIVTGKTKLAPFQLPWAIQTPAVVVGPIEDQNGSGGGNYAVGTGQTDTFGTPSPYAGQISILASAARTQTASGQYIELDAAPGNGVPLDISGWSLQSALTGTRAYIPQAASLFLQGNINPVADVMLAPNGRAIVVTGSSPVGVSFNENMCTGYLGTLQPFVPALPAQCPAPLTAIPDTPSNRTKLGNSCYDYLNSLPPCMFPATPPPSITSACRAAIQGTLSYNGCVEEYRHTSGFAIASWHLYLAHGAPLWDGQHDVIRLLDGQGRVVNVVNY